MTSLRQFTCCPRFKLLYLYTDARCVHIPISTACAFVSSCCQLFRPSVVSSTTQNRKHLEMCPGGVAKAQKPMPGLKPAFDVLDADRDGKIGPDDLRSFYNSFSNASITDEDMINLMISAADSNKNGFVEYEEFERVVHPKKNRGFGYEAVEDAFKVMDGDGDGKVGCDDLRWYFKKMGLAVSEEEIVAMMRLGGSSSSSGGDDRDSGVTCEGLRKILGFDD